MRLVRPYEPGDEESWLRCRVLAFLRTAYFDDVLQAKPAYDSASVELVAVEDDEVVGVLDLCLNGTASTIETVAVHPDRARTGVASALLEEALRRLPPEVELLDAWTRDDEAANAWYQRSGFREEFRYLHVYATGDEADAAVERTRAGLTAVTGFFHANISAEDEVRAAFRRVYVCRQYVTPVRVEDGGHPPTPG